MLAYEHAHEDAVNMGYPSLTEALEDLDRLRTHPANAEGWRDDTIATLQADLAAARKALEPFAAMGRNPAVAKGKPDACWCGQEPDVIRYGDLQRAALAAEPKVESRAPARTGPSVEEVAWLLMDALPGYRPDNDLGDVWLRAAQAIDKLYRGER